MRIVSQVIKCLDMWRRTFREAHQLLHCEEHLSFIQAPTFPPANTPKMSYMPSLFRWLQRKRYQYEVTFSLYMLTPTEKFIFSMSFLSDIGYSLVLPWCNSIFSIALKALLISEQFMLLQKADSNFYRFVSLPLPLHDHYRRVVVSSRTYLYHNAASVVLLGWRRDGYPQDW